MTLINKINDLEQEINTKHDELHKLKLEFQNLQNKFEKNYYYYCSDSVEKLVYIQSVNNYQDNFLYVTAVSITINTSSKLIINLGDDIFHENKLTTLITEKEFIEKYNTWKIQFQSNFDKILPNHKTIINI